MDRSSTGSALQRLIGCSVCQSETLAKSISRPLNADEHFFSMKYDAIVDQGIQIHERVPIPDELIPEDSRVEIDAKIHAGYCTSHCSQPFIARLTVR